jgi:hypothetical protein
MKPLPAVLALVLALAVATAAAGSGSRPAVSFGGPHNFRAGRQPNSVAVADLNGDRRLDLAVATDRGTVSVLLNRRRGHFPAKREYRVGHCSASVAIGDLNGDRKPDLAVANECDSTVSVLLNLGTARFGSRHDYATAPGTYGIAIRDLNGDGKPDLATANVGDSESEGSVSVLFGAGDGSFGAHVDYQTGGQTGIASADVNGDARADLVAASGAGLSVFLNSAEGLQAPRNYNSNGNIVAIADMNGDRKPDLVTEADVLLNRGDGSFGRRKGYTATPFYSQGLAVGDLNRDRRPDVVVGESIHPNEHVCEPEGEGGISVWVSANKGQGKLGRAVEFSTGYDGCDPTPALGDVTGDGLPDIVTANNFSGTVSVLVNAHGRCAVPPMTHSFVSLGDAKRMLLRAGCRVGIVRYAHTKRVPRGFVISEHPGWGAVLRKGASVNLLVSAGRR